MPPKKRVLTEDEKTIVEKMAAYTTQDKIADYLGISRPTLQKIIDRDKDVYLRYKKGKARAEAMVSSSLINLARKGNVTACIFYLKTQAGWRETTRHEVVGEDGGAVEHEHTHKADIDFSKLSVAEREQMLVLMQKARGVAAGAAAIPAAGGDDDTTADT